MWNLTSRPRAVSPHRWTSHSIEVYKDIDRSLIMMPDKLSQDSPMGILRARAVIPSVNISSAPKPPKKRFLEAAAAYQLEEQQKLEQQQQELLQQQQQQLQQLQTEKGKTTGEDNSALMQLAEMCVYYQASSADGNPNE